MGVSAYIREIWKKPKVNLGSLYQERMIEYRKEPVTVRLDHPTRLDRARTLGYKAKQGVFVVRQRVLRGGHVRQRAHRRSKRMSTKLILEKNYQQIAEERVSRKYTNCEVLNSYHLAQDGKHYWFEVIMVDRTGPQVLANHTTSFVKTQKGRAERGLTSAGRKSRGLRRKGTGAEKARPSRRANQRR